MRFRIVRFALAATVAASGVASGADPPHPPMPHVPHHGTFHAVEGSHDHHGEHEHEHGHCMPGVYKTEIPNFPGNGFVARKRPFTADQYTLERAGYPNEIAHRAEPSFDQHYTGYYVGGGSSLFNKGPAYRHSAKDGTWGWDYEHLGVKRRVKLMFSRGFLYQDGDGQYEPDPPFEITNIFAIRYGERLHRLIGHGGE